jgi:hypothetical protein
MTDRPVRIAVQLQPQHATYERIGLRASARCGALTAHEPAAM